ncbi:MAG: NusG domain II-containing protein [Candidatus Aegiribacteria sp.]
MSCESEYRFFRPVDLLLPLLVILVLVILGSTGPSSGSGLEFLEVHTGDTTLFHPMNRDTLMQVEGNLGEMTVVVDGLRARVADSPCPGQDCVRQGWLDKPGDMSVCVPSGVFLVVSENGEGKTSPDAVSY